MSINIHSYINIFLLIGFFEKCVTLFLEGPSSYQQKAVSSGANVHKAQCPSSNVANNPVVHPNRQTFAQEIEEKYFQTPFSVNPPSETKPSKRGSLGALQVSAHEIPDRIKH